MENQVPKSPSKSQTNSIHKCPVSENSFRITGTPPPNRLRVPKPFKYPERYKSPTDLVMSPISKGLLARSRKSGTPLPPNKKPKQDSGDKYEGGGPIPNLNPWKP